MKNIKIKDYYLLITLSLAIIFGLLFADKFILLAPFTTLFLMIILFLAALKLPLKIIVNSIDESKERVTILIATIFILVALPIIVFFITYFIYPNLAPAFFILTLAPVGVNIPFLIDLLKGNKGLGLLLVISTSLLAPLTIPLLIYLFLGGIVDINFISVLTLIVKVIFIPFGIATIVRYFISDKIDQISDKFNDISTFFLGFLFAGIVADHSKIIIETLLSWTGIFYLTALLILFFFLYRFSYFFFFWLGEKERFTIASCALFMNFVLMIVVANQFFYQYDKIIIPLILSIIPWTISLIILKQYRMLKK